MNTETVAAAIRQHSTDIAALLETAAPDEAALAADAMLSSLFHGLCAEGQPAVAAQMQALARLLRVIVPDVDTVDRAAVARGLSDAIAAVSNTLTQALIDELNGGRS